MLTIGIVFFVTFFLLRKEYANDVCLIFASLLYNYYKSNKSNLRQVLECLLDVVKKNRMYENSENLCFVNLTKKYLTFLKETFAGTLSTQFDQFENFKNILVTLLKFQLSGSSNSFGQRATVKE